MPVKYGNYKTAMDRSKMIPGSSEGEMDYNTRQVLASGGVVNKSMSMRLENPGTGKEWDWIQNESGGGPGDKGPGPKTRDARRPERALCGSLEQCVGHSAAGRGQAIGRAGFSGRRVSNGRDHRRLPR